MEILAGISRGHLRSAGCDPWTFCTQREAYPLGYCVGKLPFTVIYIRTRSAYKLQNDHNKCSVVKYMYSPMACRKYLTNAELQAIIDNWSDDDEDGNERASAIENVTCLPPDNTAGDSDCETENDNEISINISTDANPLTEIAGNIISIVSVDFADYLCVYRRNRSRLRIKC